MASRDSLEKEQLIKDVLSCEWPMFHEINGSAARAACQLDEDRFCRMRACQYRVWSRRHLESWLYDLRAAREQGRNLPAEKYIRMMETTHPGEYARFSAHLPRIPEAARRQISEILSIQLEWKAELDRLYPALMRKGRPSENSGNDTSGEVSFAVYFRAELMTFSAKTVAIFHDDILSILKDGGNAYREILLNEVRAAGYESLEKAEAACQRG
ncbi:MAG: DUF4125 family protein [Desulfovibrio sp.]|nr:DUF4125 family protein [Desulfovibrio sp.]